MKLKGRREFLGGILAASSVAAVSPGYFQARKIIRQPPGKIWALLLGTAQDAGIPHVACHKAHCLAARANPGLRRTASCVALLDEKNNAAFMLDATPDFPEQLERIPLHFQKKRKPVDGILLTHAHLGHYTGLMYLGRAAMNADAVPVYCSVKMADFIKNNGPWSLLVELGNIELRIVEPGKSYALNDQLSVEPFEVIHRAEYTDTLAFVVASKNKKLLYLPDIDRWEGMDPAITDVIKSVDYALLDATFYSGEELPGRDMSKIPHPPVTESMKLFASLEQKEKEKIYFTHLNHSNLLLDEDGQKLKALENEGYHITEEMMQLPL